VRLHHLTRNRHDDVAAAARSALVGLASDRRVLRRLLARLSDPRSSRLDCPPDRVLFLAAADPERLIAATSTGRPLLAENGVRDALVHGWTAVLDDGGTAQDEDFVRHWLAVHAASQSDDLLSVLVEACAADFTSSVALRGIGRRWLRDTGIGPDFVARRRTTRALLRSIDEARADTQQTRTRLDGGQA
jgi:hypothetical protein